ncbi:hypothetical protein [Saccharomonospora saliphila]|uniref:hypothetical protein n=1 Tax=Saccharomonospora saliphila TaxID=369829 RepID=UPI00048FC1A6|nr:hypothetical protein [Saccharomonospora saliphila]
MTRGEFAALWRRAITAEVCWLGADGTPTALTATPLLDRGVPCVALPYARADEAESLRAADTVAFAVTDSRSLPADGNGLARTGAVEVVDDLDGDHFTVELLGQELLKYPPSRVLADSPLLCRENWWWLPRIIVRLTRGGHTARLPARTDPARHALHALLVSAGGGQPRVDTAHVGPLDDAETGDPVPLRAVSGGGLPDRTGAGMVFGYDYSVPDLERWETWSAVGTVADRALEVTRRHGRQDTDLAPLRLVRRIRGQRSMAARCRRGIVAAERRG